MPTLRMNARFAVVQQRNEQGLNANGSTHTSPESQHDFPLGIYLNAGDSYAPTLIYYRGRWQIGTMADIAERHMKRD